MAFRPAADYRLAYLVHLDRRLHSGFDAQLLQSILHRQRVHHRRQHAHIIGLGPVHALGRTGHPAKDIAAADDKANLQTGFFRRLHLARQFGDEVGIDAILLIAHQHFA